MRHLLQRVSAFLYHVIDAPESARETVEAARELELDIVDAINGNYVESDSEAQEGTDAESDN